MPVYQTTIHTTMQSLWVFASVKKIPNAAALQALAEQALSDWNAHKVPVQSRVQVLPEPENPHFLVVEALSDTSGCSIDKLRQKMVEVFATQQLTIADAATIFYRNGSEIQAADFRELDALFLSGALTAETIIFDPAAIQRNSLSGWEQPLSQTWLSRYMPHAEV
jgi:hypothetical protein